MLVKVLTRRVPKKGMENKIKRYTGDLNRCVTNYNGFKKANSFWGTEGIESMNCDSLITISEWNNHNSWDKWIRCEKRMDIHNKYKDFLKEENHIVLSKKICYNLSLL